MRGKDIDVDEAVNEMRITPAHAGKSLKNSSDKAQQQDHPRTCGEKTRRAVVLSRL